MREPPPIYRGGGKKGRKAKQPYRLKTHGKYKTGAYKSWESAKQRCYNTNAARYAAYGGLGIIMCARWRADFAAFHADMGDRPPGHSLDRYPDPYGNYEPGNCRWATIQEQRANRRAAHGLSRLHAA